MKNYVKSSQSDVGTVADKYIIDFLSHLNTECGEFIQIKCTPSCSHILMLCLSLSCRRFGAMRLALGYFS